MIEINPQWDSKKKQFQSGINYLVPIRCNAPEARTAEVEKAVGTTTENKRNVGSRNETSLLMPEASVLSPIIDLRLLVTLN